MKSLIQFIIKHLNIFAFIIIEIVCFILVVSFNSYQNSKFINNNKEFTGAINEKWSNTLNYISLKEQNDVLNAFNQNLLKQVISYNIKSSKDSCYKLNKEQQFKCVYGNVVSATTSKLKNYITINLGSKDNIYADMAVINSHGIIGITNYSSDNYSTVIPLINEDLKISAKHNKSKHFGSLEWDTYDVKSLILNDIPSYVDISVGDTISTSGYSSIFPANIPIGSIKNISKDKATGFYILNVECFVNFRNLDNIYVLKNTHRQEILKLDSLNN